MIYPV